MKQDPFIEAVKKDPELETELNWYQKLEAHPWIKFVLNLFLNLEIYLLPKLERSHQLMILGLTILVEDYEIEQGTKEGSYRIKVEDIGYLDEIEDIDGYLQNLASITVGAFYRANEERKTDRLEESLLYRVRKWNWHPFVKQEEVMHILGEYLELAAEQVNMDRRRLPEVIADYYERIDRKRIENLESFIEKSEKILESAGDQKDQTRFFRSLLQEVKNGGENLSSLQDVIPQYHGMKFN